MTDYIPIKYLNKTGDVDFDVMVYTKNYNNRSANISTVAWQILRGQSSVSFKYPVKLAVGAAYMQDGLIVQAGPFSADLGSSWKITQERQTDTAVLSQSKK